jgi:hypothetical protein
MGEKRGVEFCGEGLDNGSRRRDIVMDAILNVGNLEMGKHDNIEGFYCTPCHWEQLQNWRRSSR